MLLECGEVPSAHMIELYLAQIERHNHNELHLKALICVAARSTPLQTANRLNQERESGQVRGHLCCMLQVKPIDL